jgi:Amt family ammonium transporter
MTSLGITTPTKGCIAVQQNAGDTAWMLMSTGLVMLMVLGLGLFYGGMVQSKNVLSTLCHSFFALGLITVQWAAFGYSLAFGPTQHGLIGDLTYAGLAHVGLESKDSIPHLLFVAYQGMFAAITPALISGAFAERLKFSVFCIFTLVWSTLVYDPIAHWVWATGGWLQSYGALDFAGGTVVHLSSGLAALVTAVMVGPRLGFPHLRHHPHNLTLTVIGAGLLWFGWFGFNAGSALGAHSITALAFINTHFAAAAGAVAWGLWEGRSLGKVTLLGVVSGAVAGLVGITPGAGFVSPMAALAIGAATALVCVQGVLLKVRLGYDDTLDAFGVHGIGGAFGALLTGIFAAKAINPAGADGLLAAVDLSLLGKQLLSLVAAGSYAAVVTALLLWILKKTIGLRVSPEQEREGLDMHLHGEVAYTLGQQSSVVSRSH